MPEQELGTDAAVLLRTGFSTAAATVEDEIVLKLQGELDMSTAPGLGRTLDLALDARPPLVALDLSELTFLDSTGIRVLISACRRAGKQGCELVLRSPSRSVRKALVLTGVDRLMTIDPPTRS